MTRPARLLTPLLAALAALTLLALSGSARAGVPANFFGIDSVHEPPANEFRLMAKTGAQVFRAPFSWRAIERHAPTRVFGQTVRHYDWTSTDRLMRRASQFGISIHAGLIDTPGWIAKDARTSPVRSPDGAQGWSAFVAAAVARYGPNGSFWQANPALPKNPPIAYQVWNEQNTDGRYLPKPNPREYAELLRRAGAAIRARDPRAQILPGGMFGTPQTEFGMKSWDFMRILLAQPGVPRYVDAVGVHPYSPDLRGVRYQLKTMRKQLDKLGHRNIPLQVTELGWSSGLNKDRFFFFKGPKGQARMLKRSFSLILKKRRAWKIQRAIWFSWRDIKQGEQPGCIWCARFGLLKTDLSRKPAYKQYRKLALAKKKRKRRR